MAMLQVLEDCNLWKDFPEGLHVLVVDSDSHALNEIKAKLEECKYEVTAFERSEDAVTALGNPSNSFHLALVEVAIEEGLEGFSILKARKHNNIPIIMMSETENRDIVLRAFALGAVEFLQKPLSDENLKNVWQHAVRKALSVGENELPKSLKSVKSITESPVNSSCTSNSDQIVGKEEILSEEKEDFGFLIEGKPNLGGQARGSERISTPSTPQQQHVHILNSQVNADNFSGSSEATHKGEEAQPIQAEYSGGSSSSSCVEEAKKEHDGFTMQSRMTSESANAHELCGEIDFNYCDKMEFDSASCFDDLCLGDGDLLSDLEIDPDMIAEFSLEDHGDLDMDLYSLDNCQILDKDLAEEEALLLAEVSKAEKEQLNTNFTDAAISSDSPDSNVKEEVLPDDKKSSSPESAKVATKNLQGKRKVKVDWTPDLHRRFVQAVEQLGIDKAVPSRILELMGVNCLTRHNIASHLQKYRSHRKHLLAREAEAASWNNRRQLYASPGTRPRRELTPWIANGGNALIQPRPLMGFPPMPPAPHAHGHPPPFRPLHVWGHPTLDHSLVHMWQKQPLPAAAAAPAPWPAADGTFWQQPTACKDTWGHNAPVPGTPCYPQPLVRLPLAPVTGVPHFTPPPAFIGDYYRPEDSSAIHPVHTDVTPHLKPASLHPSKETVDAAINEVLSNPWAPFPIGLKPPVLESVLTELQKHGISNVPPASACLTR